MQLAFYFDQTRCMGCNACTVACKDWNQVNPGPVRWRRQETYEPNGGSKLFSLVMSCNHCAEPACKSVCSAGAIVKRDDGLVLVDRNKCIGLKLCIDACPFSAPHIAEDAQEPTTKSTWSFRHPMQKCTMCFERIDRGEQPICVASCPGHALRVDDITAISQIEGAERISYDDFPQAYKADKEGKINTKTFPSLFIKKAKTAAITKLVVTP